MRLLLFLAVGFSITNALVFLHAFGWFRRLVSGINDPLFKRNVQIGRLYGFRHTYLGRLVRCHCCMGFWIGSFLSLSLGPFIDQYMGSNPLWVDVIGDGLLLSGFNFATWIVLQKLGTEDL